MIWTRLVGVFAAAVVAATTLTALSSLGAAATPAAEQPYSECSIGQPLNLLGTLSSAAIMLADKTLWPQPVTVDDNFAGLDTKNWQPVPWTDQCIEANHGLTLTVPQGALHWMYADAEIDSKAAYPAQIGGNQATTSFTATVQGARLSGVWGSRGWGYFHTALVGADTDFALFMYLNGPVGSSSLPSGFYAMSYGGGGFNAFRLDSSLLSQTHTYGVEWMPHEVVFRIDGKIVASATNSVPQKRLPITLWADNADYTAFPSLNTALALIPGFLPSPKDNVVKISVVTIR